MGHLEGNFTPVLYIGRKVPTGKSQFFHPTSFQVQITTHPTHSKIHGLTIKHRMHFRVNFQDLLSPSATFISYITAYPENGTCKYFEDNGCDVNISVLNKIPEA